MFSLIKQVFIAVLSFSESLSRVAKISLIELKYYPFMISLSKCNGSCNVLTPKIYIPKETKEISFKAFNMIAKKNEAKTMTKYISCDCKCKYNM